VDGQEYDDGVYQGAATLSTTDTSISICAGSPYDGETTTFVVPHGACPNGGDPDYSARRISSSSRARSTTPGAVRSSRGS